MLSTVARCAGCARQIRWPCYQKIPHRVQNLSKNTQKWHAHSRKYSQLPERNVVGVRNESLKSTDGQMNFWLGLGIDADFCSFICSCGSWFSILLAPWEDTTCWRAGWVSPKASPYFSITTLIFPKKKKKAPSHMADHKSVVRSRWALMTVNPSHKRIFWENGLWYISASPIARIFVQQNLTKWQPC